LTAKIDKALGKNVHIAHSRKRKWIYAQAAVQAIEEDSVAAMSSQSMERPKLRNFLL
jgi:hypothetical protein